MANAFCLTGISGDKNNELLSSEIIRCTEDIEGLSINVLQEGYLAVFLYGSVVDYHTLRWALENVSEKGSVTNGVCVGVTQDSGLVIGGRSICFIQGCF